MHHTTVVAYFSMEIGLNPEMPTYSGGLGMLAGDTIRSAADMNIPMVGITLMHRRGYFRQHLDETGWQTEEPVEWPVEKYLTLLPETITLTIESRTVTVRIWRYDVVGLASSVPVLLLDTDVPTNSPYDRTITHYLYGGDRYYRLCQEVILGMGGVRALAALGYDVSRYHMNEGHASLLVVELMNEYAHRKQSSSLTSEDLDDIRDRCVFTTHTPVAAGHDRFPMDLVYKVLGQNVLLCERERELCYSGELNLTYVALDNSDFVNGVAKSHKETTEHLFARYRIDSITNGVHLATWTSPHFRKVFDNHVPGWRADNASLRSILGVPRSTIWEAHVNAKIDLLAYVKQRTGLSLGIDVFTIAYARRSTPYKRPELLFNDIERLLAIHQSVGSIQIIYAGKSHPHDLEGKELIQHIFGVKNALSGKIKIVYLEEYDMNQAKLLTAGCDLWLNTPQPPLEASGTSGMKAAVNGIPSLSILDGWWIEGWIEGVTGWAIGNHSNLNHTATGEKDDAKSLYDCLENVVLPLFYRDRDRYIDVMRHAIALNASYFNTERMLNQYISKAYFI